MAPKEASTSLQLLGIRPRQDDGLSEIENDLCERTVALLEALNSRDWNSPALDDFDPGVESFCGHSPQQQVTRSKDELLQDTKDLIVSNPTYHAAIVDRSAKVNDSTGKGSVWVLQSVTGLERGLQLEGVAMLDWERRDGKWVVVRHRGYKGVPFRDFACPEAPQFVAGSPLFEIAGRQAVSSSSEGGSAIDPASA